MTDADVCGTNFREEPDRTLLEYAAKAAALKLHSYSDEGLYVKVNDITTFWNPLQDDGDALRLAVKLRLEIGFPDDEVVWSFGRGGKVSKEVKNPDPYAATRRAIVRAAAEIGKAYASEEAPDANGASSLQQMESKEL